VRGGATGALSRPTLALNAPGHLTLGLQGDFYKGNGFLLPGATTQRTGGLLSASFSPGAWLEIYGALALRSSTLSGVGTSSTLSSVGDADVGLKLVLPAAGPLTAGALLQLDLPSGVGSVSFKGAGGRAALLAALGGQLGPVPLSLTASAGYVFDNTQKLLGGQAATFPAFALDLSLYDRVEGSLALQAPLRWATPAAEVVIEVPVARARALPAGGQTPRSRLLLGFTSGTGLGSLTATAGLSLSLVRTGRIEPGALSQPGLAPDAPWTALLGLSWSFEPSLPAPSKELRWHEPRALEAPTATPPKAETASASATLPLPAGAAKTGARGASAGGAQGQPVAAEKGRLSVLVLDARSEQPVGGAWVSIFEADDAGATTGPDGRVRLEAQPGAVTLAVAREGYEPYTEPATSVAGQERPITALLLPVQADAKVRGRIFGEDGELLRATLSVQAAGAAAPVQSGGVVIAGATSSAAAAVAAVTAAASAQAAPGSPPAEAMEFEASFSLPLPHGSWVVTATAPGFRAEPLKFDLRPGETLSRDVILRRLAGEPIARIAGARLEVARPVVFASASASILGSSLPVVAALAEALRGVTGPITVAARVEASDLGVGADDAALAQRLSDRRADALVAALAQQGVPVSRLTARGLGLSKPGQPLLEVRLQAAGRPGS
jgi:outer membrane protein OmpA-like peptidoglycan-associated protein